MWREEAVEALLRAAGGPLFVSGCASNQGRFYPMFTHIVLLTAPFDVMLERLVTRTTNDYAKSPGEIEEVLANTRDIEPLLRAGATLVLDTTSGVEATVDAVAGLVGVG